MLLQTSIHANELFYIAGAGDPRRANAISASPVRAGRGSSTAGARNAAKGQKDQRDRFWWEGLLSLGTVLQVCARVGSFESV